jgi:hypothetical protein
MTKMQNELNLPTLQSRRTAMPPDLQYTQGHIVIDVRRVGFDMSDNRSDGDRCNKKGHKTRVEPTGVVNKIKCLIAFNCYLWQGVILKSARDRLGTGNNARRIGILFKSNFCRNYIRVYNCFK